MTPALQNLDYLVLRFAIAMYKRSGNYANESFRKEAFPGAPASQVMMSASRARRARAIRDLESMTPARGRTILVY